jgi:hypothetical protein
MLKDYRQFDGLHWESGSVRNFLDYCGVKAPHTGQPYTEAMLLGVSGGIVMGYFSFAYEGYDPHARILTRNTFDPLDTLLSRMGIVQEIHQTALPEKGLANLLDVLAEGTPAIVWADMFTLPYNVLPYDEGTWGMMPIVVFGYEESINTVWIADRARAPLTVTTGELAAARSRVKKDKFRVLTLDHPDPNKLPAAVTAGIWDCIKLFTEQPPKGSKNNFGFAAYKWWGELLARPKQRLSWAREFPPGGKMYAGLTSAFTDISTFGKDGNAERMMYAAFLDEASVVLNKPGLKEAAEQFRMSAQAWDELSLALLPDVVALFKETRELMLCWHKLFLNQGNQALAEIRQINARLEAIQQGISADFPLNGAEVEVFCANLRDHILRIHDIEYAAVSTLRAVMIG